MKKFYTLMEAAEFATTRSGNFRFATSDER
jgi:hypothetical protein